MGKYYVTDTNSIIYEEIDAELVVINLMTGCYYSLNESASRIWKLIVSGNSTDQIAGLLMDHFSSETDGIKTEIARILSEFVNEELISEAAGPETIKELILPDGFVLSGHFQKPMMTRHSDIKEMLQLDPFMKLRIWAGRTKK